MFSVLTRVCVIVLTDKKLSTSTKCQLQACTHSLSQGVSKKKDPGYEVMSTRTSVPHVSLGTYSLASVEFAEVNVFLRTSCPGLSLDLCNDIKLNEREAHPFTNAK